MRAVQFDHYGGRDVLNVVERPTPEPSGDEVLVEVRAAGINPGEAAIREGVLDAIYPATFPSGQGSDLAGVVVAVGADVQRFAPGDEVLGWSDQRSSQAEFVVVPEGQLCPKPAGLSWPAAGGLYVVGVTAYAAVRAVDVKPGDTVVVSAAAGGVGSLVVQLLRLRGATVVGLSSPANHDWLRHHGVLPVEYGPNMVAAIRAAAPDGVDAFIDLFGPEYVELAVELGVEPERIETIISFDAAQRHGTRAEGSSDASTPEILAAMAELVASGQIELPISATYDLDHVRDAYAELEQRHTHGKIVLLPRRL